MSFLATNEEIKNLMVIRSIISRITGQMHKFIAKSLHFMRMQYTVYVCYKK